MKVGTIKSSQNNSADKDLEVDGGKLLIGTTLPGIIGAVVVLLTFWLDTFPTSKNEIMLQDDRRKFELINFVLRNDSESIRNQSFMLLLEAELIKDENFKLRQLLENSQIPNWSNYHEFIPMYLTGTEIPDTGSVYNSSTSPENCSNK